MTTLSTINAGVRNWWLFILKGLVFIAAGIYVFSCPLASYVSLSLFFSVIILLSGISQLFFVTMNTGMKGWGWTLISGILDIIIGSYLLSYPLVTMATLPVFLGFWLLFRSFYLMGISFELKSYNLPGWGWLLAGSILLLVAGLLVINHPAAGVAGIIASTGVAFIIGGVLNIILAFKLRKLHSALPAFAK